MSKLAHSDEESMLLIELKGRWDERMNDAEFFDDCLGNRVDPEAIRRALGMGAYNDFALHMYLHVK